MLLPHIRTFTILPGLNCSGHFMICLSAGLTIHGKGIFLTLPLGIQYPHRVKRIPHLAVFIDSSRQGPNLPAKTDGSVELSKVYSPGSAENSTMRPCSTIIMH